MIAPGRHGAPDGKSVVADVPIVLSTLWVFLSSDYSSDYLLFPKLSNFLPHQLVRVLEVLVAELILHFFGNVPTSVHGMVGVHDSLRVVVIYMLSFQLP